MLKASMPSTRSSLQNSESDIIPIRLVIELLPSWTLPKLVEKIMTRQMSETADLVVGINVAVGHDSVLVVGLYIQLDEWLSSAESSSSSTLY